ncbi:hypothetical protein DFI_19490 (plasmid) [Deinococcus ficus]|uniref:Uncharacterized protein n=2 Tax=Deinococcus ficus TaxID=317577 RepID=A0A221T3C0_9DEIO|nr:hypothetical protein DFI_19490 [Deinococcus ficus]
MPGVACKVVRVDEAVVGAGQGGGRLGPYMTDLSDRRDVRRALVNVPSPAGEGAGVRLDILMNGLVRLQVVSPEGSVQAWTCDTLEEAGPLASIHVLDDALCEQFLWELDLMGLRGPSGSSE